MLRPTMGQGAENKTVVFSVLKWDIYIVPLPHRLRDIAEEGVQSL